MADESDATPPAAEGAGGQEALVGTWAKVARGVGDPRAGEAEKYPEQIEFSERGIYFGRSEETEASRCHTVWDAGRFEVVGPDRVLLSTSNDAEVVYRFEASPDALTFKDPDGCEFKYRRVGPGSSGLTRAKS